MADSTTMKPKFVPDDCLHGRDDSGGPDYDNRSAEWDDSGYVKGDSKPHLGGGGKGKK